MWVMAQEFKEIVELGTEAVTEVGLEGEAAAGAKELPAVVEARIVEHRSASVLPAVQAVAAAATGFAAGAATLALVKRLGARKLSRSRGRGLMVRRAGGENLPVVSTRTYLVQVHVIGRPAE